MKTIGNMWRNKHFSVPIQFHTHCGEEKGDNYSYLVSVDIDTNLSPDNSEYSDLIKSERKVEKFVLKVTHVQMGNKGSILCYLN